MATYKEIRGSTITAVDSDPTTALGEVFYNNTSRVLKGFRLASDAFAAGGNLGTGRYSRAHFGIQTSSVFAGGSPPSTTQGSEHYNGSSWTAGGNMNTSRRGLAGCGVLTAGLAFGGTGSGGEGSTYPGASAGAAGAAIRRNSGFTVNVTNNGSVNGSTNATTVL